MGASLRYCPKLMSVQPFTTLSGEPIRALYTEADLPPDADAAIGLPGEFPFTRGVYPSMYRGRLWTMRQFAGSRAFRDHDPGAVRLLFAATTRSRRPSTARCR